MFDEYEDHEDVEFTFEPLKPEDLNSQQKVTAAYNRLMVYAKAEHDARTMSEEKVTKLSADLTRIEQSHQELLAREGRTSHTSVGAGDAELRFYLGAATEGGIFDGERVRLYGEDSGAGYEPGLLDDTNPRTDWQKELQSAYGQFRLVALIRCKSTNPEVWKSQKANERLAPTSWKRLQRVIKRAPAAVQRAFNSTDGTGGDWVPDDIRLPELEKAIQLLSANMALGIFDEKGMVGKVETSPVLSSHAMPYKYGDVASDDPPMFTASTPGTAARTATAVAWAAHIVVDSDAAEDMVVAALPDLMDLVARTLVVGEEDAILNADTAGTHQDAIASWNPASIYPSTATFGLSNDPRTLWLGLRAKAFDLSGGTTDASGALTFSALMTAVSKLDAPHGLDGDLAAIVGQKSYLKYILPMSEVVTVEKYGPNAAVISGEIGKIGPLRIVKSFLLTDDLASTGLFTGSGATGSALIVNRSRYQRKVRRAGMVETVKDATRGINHIVGTKRGVFYNRDATAVKNVHLLYNLS